MRPLLGLAAALSIVASALPAAAVTGQEAVARARQWVDAGMPYCQAPYGGCDSHVCCGEGYRPENPAWDPYRSDCSGLVSWAWDLGGPGRVTWQFAPFDGAVSHVIDWTELSPGDAINNHDHIMLFVGWVEYGARATLIDEHNWGTNAREKDFDLWVDGSTVTRADWSSNPFTAIRYDGLQTVCTPHCEGSVIVGADCGAGDCAAYGATCADDALGVRCVSVFCAPTGDSTTCLPDGISLGTCHDGNLAVTDCAASGGVCGSAGGAHCVGPYGAEATGKGSDGMPSTSPSADFDVCAGAPVEAWFELRNTGLLTWRDTGEAAPGQSIRIGTMLPPNQDFADPFTGGGRVSLNDATNTEVHGDGPDCHDAQGCNATRFFVRGDAPMAPGLYTSSWQLVDELQTWFGPVVSLSFNVVACAPPRPRGEQAEGGSGGGGGEAGSGGEAGDGEARERGIEGGCSMGGGPASPWGALATVALGALGAAQRRTASRSIARLGRLARARRV